MTYKLFLDDERFPAGNDDWFIARTANDAAHKVTKDGMPISVSLDHDLGDGPTGAEFVIWLIGHMLDEDIKFPSGFVFYVHSMNPVGAANIRHKMETAIKHIGYEE